MDGGAWQTVVQGGHKEADVTHQLNNSKQRQQKGDVKGGVKRQYSVLYRLLRSTNKHLLSTCCMLGVVQCCVYNSE